MRTDNIRVLLKKDYNYDGEKLILKNVDCAIVETASIATSAGAPHVQPKRNIDGIDEPYYFLCGETETPTTSHLRNNLDNVKDDNGNSLYKDDDYIVAIELYTQPQNTGTLRQFGFSEIVDEIKKYYSIGIYRKNRKATNPKNSYLLVFIRIKENGKLTT